MFQHILVPYDFGPAAERALEVAIDLAALGRGRITLLHVCEGPLHAFEGMAAAPVDLLARVDAAQEKLDVQVGALRDRFPDAEGVLAVGAPHEGILAEAERRECDLIVMGTHGRRGLSRAALGSVAEKVVRLSQIPVLTLHAAPAATAPERA